MSTLKVANIESQSGGGVSAKISDVGGGPLSNRNLIINGAMTVSQRATQVTGVTTADYRTCDRYHFNVGTLGTWTVDQSTDAPDGFSNSFKVTCTTADASPAAADALIIGQRIEAQNLQHLKFGTGSALPLFLSFWVKSNKTGLATFSSYQPDASNRLISKSYTINAPGVWEYKTISIPGDTAGGFDNNNDVGLFLEFWLNSGSDYDSGALQTTWGALDQTARNAENLGVGGAINDYFAITGIQLEIGDFASTFEHRSYGDELARCQRYFVNASESGAAGNRIYAVTATNAISATTTTCGYSVNIPLPGEMRIDNPTVGGATIANMTLRGVSGAVFATASVVPSMSIKRNQLSFTNATNFSVESPTQLRLTSSTGLTFNAEL